MRRAAEAGDRRGRASRSPTYSAGSWPSGAISPLVSSNTEERVADPVGDRSHGLRQRAGGDRQADEVEARQARSPRPGGRAPSRAAPLPPGSGGSLPPRLISAACSAVRAPSCTSSPPRASSTATAVPQLPAPITAARRIGGRPPISSHCRRTLGQIRAVTDSASRRGRLLDPREGHRLAEPHPDLTRADAPAAAHVLGAEHSGRQDRRAGLQRQPPDPAPRRRPGCRGGSACPRETCRPCRRARPQPRGLHRHLVGLAAADREGAEPREQPPLPAALEQLDLGDVVHRPPPGQRGADREGVEEAAMVGGDDQPAADAVRTRDRSGEPEVDEEERGHEDPGEEVQRPD